jgi:NAD(P)-dependent dehydrogenase (short-subunit alcohol dehydrogenase family)
MFNNVFPQTIVPVERIGTEEDMAGCILYLTSRAGAYLSGSVMLTDGGSLSILPATY